MRGGYGGGKEEGGAKRDQKKIQCQNIDLLE